MDLLPKFIKFSEKNFLIIQNDSILVALSGGADSVVLLHLLSRLRKKMNLSVSAVYLNHQLRENEAKKEETFCQKLCGSLDIELHLASVDIAALAKKNKKGIEETARDYRYQLFETLANEYAYTKVALGHHQNDQVETILFRIFRGTGKTGLKGIPSKRGIFIRPLLEISKDEILSYIDFQKLKYCEDKSNDESVYKRNYIRNRLIPLLKANLNQSVERAILNLSETISEEELFLDSIVQKKIKKIVSVSVGYKILLKKNLFLQCNQWVQRRILRQCIAALSQNNVFPNKATVDRLINAVHVHKKALSIPQKLEMHIFDELVILSPRKRLTFKQKLSLSDSCYLKKLDYIIESRVRTKIAVSLRNNKNGMIGRFDLAKINKPLYIRSIEDGDRFRPFGMQGTKKIGNYLTDKKIQCLFRDEVPVLVDKNRVLWVIGHQIDDRVKVDKNTVEVLEIECKQRK